MADDERQTDALDEVPVVILAGSDRRPGPVPAGGEGFHFVVGYKGAEIRVGDRPLIAVLIERLRASGAFAEVWVAGPKNVYEGLVDAPIVDTDGTVGENLRRAERHVRSLRGSDARIAFIACDILPSVEEIAELTAQLKIVMRPPTPDAKASPALAISLCSVDASSEATDDDEAVARRLGSSVWKPRYSIRPTAGAEPIPFLPGHLAIAWPARLRTGLFYRLLRLAYQERNRDLDHRKRTIVLRVLSALLWRDLRNLLRLEWPLLTYTVLRRGLGAFFRWRRGEWDVPGLEKASAGVCVRRRTARACPGNAVRIVLTSHLSFAKDLDTREEIAELNNAATDGEDRTDAPD